MANHWKNNVLPKKRTKDSPTHLEDAVLLTERVEQRVHGVQHGHHLHGRDVAADASESLHVAEQDGHIGEHLQPG